jgi:hypothetical protein
MSTADMLIHIHPELDAQKKDHLAKWIADCDGVDCVELDHHTSHYALIVKYDPDKVQSVRILNMVRQMDPVATIVGL